MLFVTVWRSLAGIVARSVKLQKVWDSSARGRQQSQRAWGSVTVILHPSSHATAARENQSILVYACCIQGIAG
ncbi:hypothetical protein B0H14DRAFT_2812809 [Mycena olivaceomarginata]|nr:hypothetical protein B0H14DRAFT_2812809 [Mycena olivaceomarginata]